MKPELLPRRPKELTAEGPVGQFHWKHFGPIAEAIRGLFDHHGCPIKPTSSLDGILKSAEALGVKASDPNESLFLSPQELFDSYCCARLANSVLALDYRPAYRRFFSELQMGDLNFWNSIQSKAKDTEWELFLWSHLNRAIPNAAELYEPDILLRLPFRAVGIACKKAYSKERVLPQIEAAARQIAASGMPGVIALSLDFLLGKDAGQYTYINARHTGDLRGGLKVLYDDLWRTIGPKVGKKYLRPGRVMGIIFAVHSYAALPDTAPGYTEICSARFQSDALGPSASTQLMDYLHGTEILGGFMNDVEIAGRLAALKELRPVSGT